MKMMYLNVEDVWKNSIVLHCFALINENVIRS